MTNEQNNTGGDRLEGLLRQWGAEEAARDESVPPAPNAQADQGAREAKLAAAVPARAGRAWAAALRWAPLAAAAMLLAAAGGVYWAAMRKGTPARGDRPRIEEIVAAFPAELADANAIARLRAELAELRKSLGEGERRLAELADLSGKAKELQEELDRERRRHGTDVAELVAATQAREKEKAALAEANETLTAKAAELEGQLEALSKLVAKLEPDASEAPKLRQAAQDLQARLAGAVNEMDQLRRQRGESDAAAADARQTAQALEARHAEVVAAFQRTYLASIAPNERGLAARKTAVRIRRMVERCAELSPDVRDDGTRKLLARLEAVLTRLDLLNPARAGSEEAFSKLLDEADLARQIDEVLSAGTEPESVRTWLFEAKLILMGGGHAG